MCFPSSYKSFAELPYIVRLRMRYNFSRNCLKILIPTMLFTLTTYYAMNVASNYASHLDSEIPLNLQIPLRDKLFSIIPYLNQLWTVDVSIYLSAGTISIIILLFHPQPLMISCKAGLIFSLCNILRSTTVFVTSLPDPRPGCIFISSDELATGVTLHRCGDEIFSGHMVIIAVSTLVAFQHTSMLPTIIGIIYKIFMLILSVAGIYFIIANRSHYSVDVLLGIYIAVLTYISFSATIEQYVIKYQLFPDLCNWKLPSINNTQSLQAINVRNIKSENSSRNTSNRTSMELYHSKGNDLLKIAVIEESSSVDALSEKHSNSLPASGS